MREKLNELLRALDVSGEGPKDARRRRLLYVMLLGVSVSAVLTLMVLLVVAPSNLAGAPGEVRLLTAAAGTALLGAGIIYAISRYWSEELASVLFLVLLIALAAISDTPEEVVNGRGLIVFAIPILAASALLRPWASFAAAAVCSAVVVAIGLIVLRQPLPNVPVIFAFFLLALVSWLSARNLERAWENLSASNQRLQESEARFRATFENAAIGIALVDSQGRVTSSNAALQRILGYSDEELRGMHLTKITHPEDRGADWRRFQALMRGECDAYQMEKRYCSKAGRVIWGRLATSRVEDPAGQTAFAVGMLEDITERKQAERALRERVKELTCLHAVSRDMQRDLSREELCQRIVEHLIPAMRYSEIAVPLIELDGRRFTARKVSEGLRHSIQADVHLGDETRGRVSVYYAEERPFLIPEEQDLLDSIAEALGRWLERKQVQEEIREQLRYNEALLEIDRAISSTLELDQVLDLVLEQLGEVLPYESASLFLLSDGSVELVAARGHPHPDRATEVAFSVEDDALTRAVLNREHPLILDDAQADDRFQARGEASYVRSWIGVPLTTKGTRIGIMTIDHHEAGFYDDASAAKVEAFARQAAVAIDNARLFEQAQREIVQRRVAEQALERQLRRVSLLNEIAHAMAARQDLDSIFRVVVQKLEDRFADVVSIWLREGDAFTLASAGDQIWQAVRESSLPAEVSLPSEAAADFVQGELRHAADLTRLDLPLPQRVAQELTIRSAVTAPLVAEGEILGALVSGRHERGAFSDKELDFLKGLSRHVALAIHQAQLHDNLQAAYDDLRETQQAMMRQERLGALGEMASGIAHDINNAISPIPLYTQLIRRAMDLDEQAMRHLRTIERAVEDVEETVGRMRQFYRKREEREFTPLALNKAARQAIQLTRPRWRDMPQERGITIDLETDFAEDLPPVMGNEAEIRQAVTNLILNAVDAMPDGGVLSVRTGMAVGAPPRVVLKVSDTGVGMDEETQRRCFEPFFSTKGERGSGMGLATVYGTMQRHDGDVEVESAPGEGTTMRLLFPVREVTGRDEVREGVAPPSPLRILCVDDESRVRQALQEALEGKGHAVELADGGESGLAAFRAARRKGQPFDVVITDLGMPYVDGREVARSVKREAPETPVILLTGWGKRLSAQNDVPEAVDLLLSKPASIETLNRALARVVTKGGPTSSQ